MSTNWLSRSCFWSRIAVVSLACGLLGPAGEVRAQGLSKEFIYSGGRLVAVEMAATSNDRGTIFREHWNGISGTSVASLTGDADYPSNPDGVGLLSAFEAPMNWADNYGQRIRGYLRPPTTGNYSFWIASNDDSQLRLSTDSDPANATQIASVSGATLFREWDKYSSQASSAIYLVGGREYYIEALHKDGTGEDHLSVAWSGPGMVLR